MERPNDGARKLLDLVQRLTRELGDLRNRVEALERKRQRTLRAKPQAIALAAHLYWVRGVPAKRVHQAGVLSQAQMQNLTEWPKQAVQDFCADNRVLTILREGLPDEQAEALAPGWAQVVEYINTKRDGVKTPWEV